MRRCLPLCLGLIALALPGAPASGQRLRSRCVPVSPCFEQAPLALPVPQAPAGAVRRVLDEQVAAWNKGDLERFMAGYWASPDLTFYSGSNVTRGWQATLDRYRKRYQSEGQEMGQLAFRDVEVTVLGADSALVRGRYQLVRKKDRPSGLFTLLFRRLPEGWRIVHDHTSN